MNMRVNSLSYEYFKKIISYIMRPCRYNALPLDVLISYCVDW